MLTPPKKASTLRQQSASKLTHFDSQGQAHMVDVGAKSATRRVAIAQGIIFMQPDTLQLILSGQAHKGDVLGVARLAAIMGAKKTADLIPLCHPVALTHIAVELTPIDPTNTANEAAIRCMVTAETIGQTGVEMEALTGVQIGLLTIYDMCKAVDRGMRIESVQLLEKQGGKSGHFKAQAQR